LGRAADVLARISQIDAAEKAYDIAIALETDPAVCRFCSSAGKLYPTHET
jgi:hypothetical protein